MSSYKIYRAVPIQIYNKMFAAPGPSSNLTSPIETFENGDGEKNDMIISLIPEKLQGRASKLLEVCTFLRHVF